MKKRQPASSAPSATGSLGRQAAHPVGALQGAIGNRATGRVLARSPDTAGTVKFGRLPSIKVEGGNLDEWRKPGAAFDTVEVTSKKGAHSAKLQKASTDRTKADVTVEIKGGKGGGKTGEDLKIGLGTRLEIKDARITGYSVDSKGVETWRLSGFEQVKRTTITAKIGS